jgi:hypothetical protein
MSGKQLTADRGEGIAPNFQEGPAWKAAIESGFDMSLIELNLELEPWERLLQHDDTLAFAMRLQAAVKESCKT